MQKTGLLIIFLLIAAQLHAQGDVVDDLAHIASFSDKKANTYLVKKGFRHTGKDFINDTIADTWEQVVLPEPDSGYSSIRRLIRYQSGKQVAFALQTPLEAEYNGAVAALGEAGFAKGPGRQKEDNCSYLFQRKNQTVATASYNEDGTRYYSLVFQEKKMPPAKSVIYGEDLLQFDSHAYLEYFFGAANVRKDVYFFSEKELQKCSILFPNTPHQAVFIWNDEQNLNGLSHIIISGTLTTENTAHASAPASRNAWRTASGVYINMRIEQLLARNDEDFSFFGQSSENYLTVLPQQKGNIDFTRTGVVFDCFNCGSSPVTSKQVVSAAFAVENNLRLHVAMIILIPGGKTEDHNRWAKR